MPHVTVKLYPGRSEEAKQRLTRKITQAILDETGCKERSISVAIEEVAPEDWAEAVFREDILNTRGTLYKEPGYNPFAPKETETQTGKDLMTFVREAAEAAAKEAPSGQFNPMSWLDQELEDRPGRFDSFFEVPWQGLSDEEKPDRLKAIRAVL